MEKGSVSTSCPGQITAAWAVPGAASASSPDVVSTAVPSATRRRSAPMSTVIPPAQQPDSVLMYGRKTYVAWLRGAQPAATGSSVSGAPTKVRHSSA